MRRETCLWLALLLLVASAGEGESRAGSTGAAAVDAAAPTPYLEVIGTVQDGGLPHAGCTCDRCLLALRDPQQRRHVASLALIGVDGRSLHLFDATPDLREQLNLLLDRYPELPGKVDRRPVSGVFLTHAHMGHYLGLAFFGYEAIHAQDLPVFTTPRMAEFLRTNGPWSQLVEFGNIALQPLVLGQPRQLEPQLSVTAIRHRIGTSTPTPWAS